MASNDERQTIANKLRYLAMCPRDVLLRDWWCRLQKLVTGDVDIVDPQETFLALADLIEPRGDDDGDE